MKVEMPMLWVILINLLFFPIIVYADQKSPRVHLYYSGLVKLSFVIMVALPLLSLGLTWISLPAPLSLGTTSLGIWLYPLSIRRVSGVIPESIAQYLEFFVISFGPLHDVSIPGIVGVINPLLWLLTVFIMVASSVISWIIALELGMFLRGYLGEPKATEENPPMS
jgi:hypothetical protein